MDLSRSRIEQVGRTLPVAAGTASAFPDRRIQWPRTWDQVRERRANPTVRREGGAAPWVVRGRVGLRADPNGNELEVHRQNLKLVAHGLEIAVVALRLAAGGSDDGAWTSDGLSWHHFVGLCRPEDWQVDLLR